VPYCCIGLVLPLLIPAFELIHHCCWLRIDCTALFPLVNMLFRYCRQMIGVVDCVMLLRVLLRYGYPSWCLCTVVDCPGWLTPWRVADVVRLFMVRWVYGLTVVRCCCYCCWFCFGLFLFVWCVAEPVGVVAFFDVIPLCMLWHTVLYVTVWYCTVGVIGLLIAIVYLTLITLLLPIALTLLL